jgi:DNA-binding CsgD family transcriptional regulator
MIGVIDLTCAAEDFSPLLLPFAMGAAREIGHRLREEVNPHRLPARSWLSLTDTERAVAHLAAKGLASRVVADRMRLPQPAVRSHLRRVFRKLAVRSRVELARVIEQGAAWARTMAAVDDARRRIERDLHDGLQQRLAALGLQVRGRGFGPGRRRCAEVGTGAGGAGPVDSASRILQVRRTRSARQP